MNSVDGSLSFVAGIGSIKVSKDLTLESVLHVPTLRCNLLSISKLTRDNNCVAIFHPSTCYFQDLSSGRTIGSARVHKGLYYLEDIENESQQAFAYGVSLVSVSSNREIMLWHHRLGHPNFLYLKHLLRPLFKNKSTVSFHCDICQYAKHTRVPFSPKPYIPSIPFALIHSDIWGPSRITTMNGKRWFVTFIDDHTRTTWVYLLREKSETCQVFQNFNNMIQTQFQKKVCVLRTYNKRE